MSAPVHTLDLPALDGANPLGFLAALGTLTVLAETDPTLKLGWHARARWVPFLTSTNRLDKEAILHRLATHLRGQRVAPTAERKRVVSQGHMDVAKRRLKDAQEALKAGNQLKAERERMVEPLKLRFERRRMIVRARRSVSVPSPELAIGKKVDLSAEEFRSTAESFLQGEKPGASAIAMFAGLASESCSNKQCPRTHFDFVDSSGQLAFLEAVLQLMSRATPEKLEASLFHSWKRTDEKYSLRFDPVEDRRYALLDRDPTASNNKSTSEWMANLLAYRALRFFPCVITRQGSETTGWTEIDNSRYFTWPLWAAALSKETIGSLLAHRDLFITKSSAMLRYIGVKAMYRSQRIANGEYINFSPACAVM